MAEIRGGEGSGDLGDGDGIRGVDLWQARLMQVWLWVRMLARMFSN